MYLAVKLFIKVMSLVKLYLETECTKNEHDQVQLKIPETSLS
jgi:hypothetical protein